MTRPSQAYSRSQGVHTVARRATATATRPSAHRTTLHHAYGRIRVDDRCSMELDERLQRSSPFRKIYRFLTLFVSFSSKISRGRQVFWNCQIPVIFKIKFVTFSFAGTHKMEKRPRNSVESKHCSH